MVKGISRLTCRLTCIMDATESEAVREACSVRVVYTTTPHRYGDMGCEAGAVSCIECWPVVSQVSQR